MRWTVLATACLVGVLTFGVAANARNQKQGVKIGNTTYFSANLTSALNLIPSSSARLAAKLTNLCKAAKALAYGSSATQVGIVAWIPTNPIRCLGVEGGGGVDAPTLDPCSQLFRTPDGSYYVLIVATSSKVCRDLSTQVPEGGVVARTNSFYRGSPARFRITCQQENKSGELFDYVTPASVSLPGSTAAYWIVDQQLDTNNQTWLDGVPECAGVNDQIF